MGNKKFLMQIVYYCPSLTAVSLSSKALLMLYSIMETVLVVVFAPFLGE